MPAHPNSLRALLALTVFCLASCTGASKFKVIDWPDFHRFSPAPLSAVLTDPAVALGAGEPAPHGGWLITDRSRTALLEAIDRDRDELEKAYRLVADREERCDDKVEYEQELRQMCQSNRALGCAACAGMGAGAATAIQRGLDGLGGGITAEDALEGGLQDGIDPDDLDPPTCPVELE